MKNLFEYATKELSQDAFLMWFLESWNEPDVGEHVTRFLESVTGLSIGHGILTRLKTHAQVNHIDVTCDFWIGDEQHLLIIEDKTGSSEHGNQLDRYTESIARWKNESNETHKNVYLLYYKTSYLDESEARRVKDAVGYQGKKWLIWDLKTINEFFSKVKSNSVILNQYIEHVRKIQTDLESVSDLPIREWSFRNWEGYFRKKLLERIREKFKDRYDEKYDGRTYFWGYQGRYVSINHFIDPCVPPSGHVGYHTKLDLELFIRPWQDELTATIHPVVSDEKDERETWKCQQVFTDPLRKRALEHGGNYFKRLRTKQCIGKFGKGSREIRCKSSFTSVEELTTYILNLLDAYHRVFEGQIPLDKSITKYEQIAIIKPQEDE